MGLAIHYITIMRRCWLCGRPGGGKSALSVEIALRLIEGAFARSIVSNMALALPGWTCVITDSVGARDVADSVIILDEGWQELSTGVHGGLIRAWLAVLRKKNQYILLPSVMPITRDAAVFKVERVINGLVLGVPAWVYRFSLAGSYRDRGHFIWWHPSKVFSMYDHMAVPDGKFYIYTVEQHG